METESISQLSALAHPRRLAVFRLLMRRAPDALPAGEIAEVLALPASSLSAALAQLRAAGLIRQTREGTSLRYSADTDNAAQLIDYLAADCCRGRPNLCQIPPAGQTMTTDRKLNVLFLCTGNSARSIFAETLLRDSAGGRFTVHSAGTHPYSDLNPTALQVLRDKGHDIRPLRSKHMSEYQAADAPRMDFVFTVCDRAANEDCPPWPGQPVSGHWGVPDPVKATGTEAERQLAFQQAYGQLRNRIRAFAALPLASLDRASLQSRIDDISHMKDTE